MGKIIVAITGRKKKIAANAKMGEKGPNRVIKRWIISIPYMHVYRNMGERIMILCSEGFLALSLSLCVVVVVFCVCVCVYVCANQI